MWASSDYTHSDTGTYVDSNRDLDSRIYSVDDEMVSKQVRTVQRRPKMALKVPAQPVVIPTTKATVSQPPPMDMNIIIIFIIVVLMAALVMMVSSYTKILEQTLALAVGMIRNNKSL